MRSRSLLPYLMTSIGVLALASTAGAQDSRGKQEAAERELQQRLDEEAAAREREAAQRESELERARARLDEAAREVARLSREAAEPAIGNFMRTFRWNWRRATLGLSIDDADRGARVLSVSPNGPAAEAGIVTGDVIVGIGGVELASGDASRLLIAQLEQIEPGADVTLEVLRDGKERDVTVKTQDPGAFGFAFSGPRGDVDFTVPAPPGGPNLFTVFGRGPNAWRAMQLVTLTPALGAYFGTDEGLLVVRGPTREELGLRDGDVILDIGGRKPTTPEHAMRILASFEPGEAVRITVMRNKRRETLDFAMPSPADPREG